MTQPITAKELAELLDRHANRLRLFAAQWSNSPDDCVQEAFVKLAAQPRTPEKPVAWLYQVVRRRAQNDLRANKRRINREQMVAKDDLSDIDPTEEVSLEEQQQRIKTALDSLPTDSRELIVLRIWSDLTWSEIAKLTGCSTSAAQRRFVAALVLMKERLESKCLTKPE